MEDSYPKNLRDLFLVLADGSRLPKEKLFALQGLEDAVCHQCVSVGQDSAETLARLVDISENPSVGLRPDILRLVRKIRDAVGPWRRHHKRWVDETGASRFARMAAWEDRVVFILDSKLPSLLRLLDDDEAGVRGAASDVLSRIDKDHDRVLRILVDKLETEVVPTVIVDLIEAVARLVKRTCVEGSEPLLEQVIADVSASNLNWKKVSLALSLIPYEYCPRRELWKATVVGASQEDISIICAASWMCDRSIAWALEGRH